MDSAVTVAVITGGISAIATIVTVLISAEKNNALQDERIKVINENIKKLENKVEQHNNFGLQLASLQTRVDLLEKN